MKGICCLTACGEEAKVLRKSDAVIQKLVSEGWKSFALDVTVAENLLLASAILRAKQQCGEIKLIAVSVNPKQTFTCEAEKQRYIDALSGSENVKLEVRRQSKENSRRIVEYLVDNCGLVVALWNGDQSSETIRTIRCARKKGKEVEIIII